MTFPEVSGLIFNFSDLVTIEIFCSLILTKRFSFNTRNTFVQFMFDMLNMDNLSTSISSVWIGGSVCYTVHKHRPWILLPALSAAP